MMFHAAAVVIGACWQLTVAAMASCRGECAVLVAGALITRFSGWFIRFSIIYYSAECAMLLQGFVKESMFSGSVHLAKR